MKSTLLDREDYRIRMRKFLESRIEQTLDLSPDTRWDYLKLGIQEFSITFYSELTRKNREMEVDLDKRLRDLQEEMPLSDLAAEEYQSIKRELFQLQLLKSRESMIRSSARWVSLADCPSKYFLNLEKRNFDDRTVSSIFNDDGILLTLPQDVQAYQKQHFSRQHADSMHSCSDPHTNTVPFSQHPRYHLEEADTQELDSPLNLEEMYRALKSMNTGKSPGSDGIPSEFYITFWDLLGPLLLATRSHSLQNGLTPDQRRAVLTLIPKKGRDKRHLSNWRPISVLNVDYKTYSP